MSLADFANVFSRSFVVGYFLPAFFGVVVVDFLTSEQAHPHGFEKASSATKVLLIGAVALLIGLLLSGLNRPLVRLLEGYPIKNGKSKIGQWLSGKRLGRWQRKYDQLTLTAARSQPPSRDRTLAAQRLQQRFPARRDLVLPTALGNVIRSFETHPRRRYGLDGVTLWPRVELLLGEDERNVIADAQANVTFFLNSGVAVVAIVMLVIADRIWHAGSLLSGALPCLVTAAVGIVLTWGAYRGAVQAAVSWGQSIRAAFDIHRLDVYAKLGVRTPLSPSDEERLAKAVTRCLLYGEPIEQEFRKQ